MKLTKAQRAVLERMAKGDEVWTTSSLLRPTAFWYQRIEARRPSLSTIHALARTGAIEDYDTVRRTGHKYRITDAGRKALEGEDG